MGEDVIHPTPQFDIPLIAKSLCYIASKLNIDSLNDNRYKNDEAFQITLS